MNGTLTVVNKKGYIPVEGHTVIYIGRGSVLGNPYPLPKYSRMESILKYKEDFLKDMLDQTPRRREIQRIVARLKAGENIHLQCFCKPLACHGDVVKEYIEYILS